MVLQQKTSGHGPSGGYYTMSDYLKKVVLSLHAIDHLKRLQMLNVGTARLVLADPDKATKLLETGMAVSRMLRGPFELPDNTVKGPIFLATAENNQPVGLYPEECHVLLPGMTKIGKTTLLRLIFSQALALSLRVWLFVRAEDLRCLLDIDKNILIDTFDSRIKIGALNPCSIPKSDYCNLFSDILCQSESIYPGTKNYLMDKLNYLYKRSDTIPSLHELFHLIKNEKGRPGSRTWLYRDSAINRLGGILSGTLGNVFDCSVGHEKSLFNRNCIFETGNLTREQQAFIVNLLITNLFKYREGKTNENWMFVGIDDANLIFDRSAENRPDFGLPIIHDLICRVRKSKINVFCCTQTPHQISSSIHSNSSIKIIFTLGDGRDFDVMFKSIGNLTPEQKAFCYTLPERHVVIKNAIRFREPFLGIIPELPDARIVGSDEVTSHNEAILADLPPIVPWQEPEGIIKKEGDKLNGDSEAKTYLHTVYAHKGLKSQMEVYKLANLKQASGHRKAKKCEALGLISMVIFGQERYPQITQKGLDYLEVKDNRPYGKGVGYEHRFFQMKLHEHFKEYSPQIDRDWKGKFVDLALITEDKIIAVEIQMNVTHTRDNIEKDIQISEMDSVIITGKDKKILEDLEKIVSTLPDELKSKTVVYSLSKLLKEDPHEIIGTLQKKVEGNG
jgi:hypothetical protein